MLLPLCIPKLDSLFSFNLDLQHLTEYVVTMLVSFMKGLLQMKYTLLKILFVLYCCHWKK